MVCYTRFEVNVMSMLYIFETTDTNLTLFIEVKLPAGKSAVVEPNEGVSTTSGAQFQMMQFTDAATKGIYIEHSYVRNNVIGGVNNTYIQVALGGDVDFTALAMSSVQAHANNMNYQVALPLESMISLTGKFKAVTIVGQNTELFWKPSNGQHVTLLGQFSRVTIIEQMPTSATLMRQTATIRNLVHNAPLGKQVSVT